MTKRRSKTANGSFWPACVKSVDRFGIGDLANGDAGAAGRCANTVGMSRRIPRLVRLNVDAVRYRRPQGQPDRGASVHTIGFDQRLQLDAGPRLCCEED